MKKQKQKVLTISEYQLWQIKITTRVPANKYFKFYVFQAYWNTIKDETHQMYVSCDRLCPYIE